MALISKTRFININYNGRTYLDDTFNLNGKNTIILFENSGGKSVSLKFIMAPFLWKYKKYPPKVRESLWEIDSFFDKFNGPTYIMHELLLDNGQKMLITEGIYKDGSDDDEVLSKYVFVTIYDDENTYDYSLKNFPIVINGIIKKPKELYNSLKSNPNIKCFSNKINTAPRTYEDFKEYLREYSVNIDFITDIMPIVLSSEGGITSVFSKYKTFQSLLQNFIIPMIENKIDNSDDKNISTLIDSAIMLTKNKKEHKDNLEMYEKLKDFLEKQKSLLATVENKEKLSSDYLETESLLNYAYYCVNELLRKTQRQKNEEEQNLEKNRTSLTQIEFEEASCSIIEKKEDLESQKKELNRTQNDLIEKNKSLENLKRTINLYQAYLLKKEIDELNIEIKALELEKKPFEEKNQEIQNRLNKIGPTIYSSIQSRLVAIQKEIDKRKEYIASLLTKKNEGTEERNKSNLKIDEITTEIIGISSKMEALHQRMEQFKLEHPDFMLLSLEWNPLTQNQVAQYRQSFCQEIERFKDDIDKVIKKKQDNIKEQQSESDTVANYSRENIEKQKQLSSLQIDKKYFDEILEKIKELISTSGYESDYINNLSELKNVLESRCNQLESEIKLCDYNERKLTDYIHNLNENKVSIDKKLIDALNENGIIYDYGLNYLKKFNTNEQERKNLYERIPYIIYSIVLTKKEFEKLSKYPVFQLSDFCTPIIVKEDIEKLQIDKSGSIVNISNMNLYIGIPENVYNNNFFSTEIENTNKLLSDEKNHKKVIIEKKNIFESLIREISSFKGLDYGNTLSMNILELEKKITQLESSIAQGNERIQFMREEENELQSEHKKLETILYQKEQKLTSFENIVSQMIEISPLMRQKDALEIEKKKLSEKILKIDEFIKQSIKEESENTYLIENLSKQINEIREIQLRFLRYKENYSEGNEDDSFEILIEEFDSLQESLQNPRIKNIEQDLRKAEKRYSQKLNQFQKYSEYSETEYMSKDWSFFDIDKKFEEKDELMTYTAKLAGQISVFSDNLKKSENNIIRLEERIRKKYNKEPLTTCEKRDFDQEKKFLENESTQLKKNISKKESSINFLKIFLKEKAFTIPTETMSLEIDEDNFQNVIDRLIQSKEELKAQISSADNKIRVELSNINNSFRNIVEIEDIINKLIGNQNRGTLNSNLIKVLIYKIEEKIKSIEKDINFITQIESQLTKIVNEFAEKLYTEYKKLIKVGKRNKIKSPFNGIEDVQLISFSDRNVEGNKTLLESSLKEMMDAAMTKEENEITEFFNKELTSYFIFSKYINIQLLNLYIKKRDINNYKTISYDEFIQGKHSGAQGMIMNLIMIQTFKEYKEMSDFSERKLSPWFLFQDNPFAKIQGTDFVNEFFELANNYKLQFWNWTNIYIPNILYSHDVSYQIKVIKSKDREYNKVEQMSGDTKSEEFNEIHEAIFEQQELQFS